MPLVRLQPVHAVLAVAALLSLPRLVAFWWDDPIHSLGLLVAPWAAWRVLRRQGEGAEAPAALMALGTAVLVLAAWTGRAPYMALLALMGALATVAAANGRLGTAALPLVLLGITVPPPGFDGLLLASQQAVAVAADGTLGLVGVDTWRDGFLLHTAANTYRVEPLCTGLSGLLATGALVGMAVEHLRPPRMRAVSALAVGLVATALLNVLRIVVLVAVTEAHGPRLIEGAFHGAVGLGLTLVAFAAAIPLLVRRPA